MDIRKQARYVRGVVSRVEDQRYSSTHVSGGNAYTTVHNGVAYTSTTPVTSSVRHHQIQKIWLRDENGREDSYQFNDENIDVLEGHHVSLISSGNTGRIYRFTNRSTGYYWRIRGMRTPQLAGRVMARIGATIRALFTALPLFNIFSALGRLGEGFGTTDFKYRPLLYRVLSLAFLLFLLPAYLPLASYLDSKYWPADISITLGPEANARWTARIVSVPWVKKQIIADAELRRRNTNAKPPLDVEKYLLDYDSLPIDEVIDKYNINTRTLTLLRFQSPNKWYLERTVLPWMGGAGLILFLIGIYYNQVRLSGSYHINSELDALCSEEINSLGKSAPEE